MFFRSEPSWWIVLLLGQTLSKKYGHKKNKNIYSVSKQGSTKRKWPEFQLVLWKSSYVALSFCFPMATYVPLRYLPSKELFLSHTIPVLRCTDGDQNDVLLLPDYSGIGSLWCFLGYSTFNPFFFFFFLLFLPDLGHLVNCACPPTHWPQFQWKEDGIYLLLIIPTEKVWNPQYRQILFVPKSQKQFWSVYWTRKNYWLRTIMSETDNYIAKTFTGICKYKFTK